DRGTLYRVRTPELPLVPAPNGAGDLVSALFLGQYLKTGNPQAALELMADSVYSVFERSFADGSRELRLVQSQDSFVSGGRRFAAEAL
ncbi:MAG: pyridoxal kinase, partial [Rectinema sp.]